MGLDPESNAHALSLWGRWVRDRPVLYHGTRCHQAILSSDVLRAAAVGDRCVSLTRSPLVATYFAMLSRDKPDDGGAVLAFDRISLASRYAIDVRHCSDWDGCGHGPDHTMFDEAEEAIWQDIKNVSRFVIAVIPIAATFPPIPDLDFASHPPLSVSRQLPDEGGEG